MIVLTWEIFGKNSNNNNTKLRCRQQISDCQNAGRWVDDMGEVFQKLQTSSYKMIKSWGCNSQHSDFS